MELIKPKRVVVERSTWIRGGDSPEMGITYLCQSPPFTGKDGVQRKCCLGFWCEAAGVPTAELCEASTPVSLDLPVPVLVFRGSVSGRFEHSAVCIDMINVNDASNIDDGEREKVLKTIAASAGVELVFVD